VGKKIQLAKIVSDIEKKWILNKLKESDWNRQKAATLLGITRKMLTDRITKYGIKIPKKQSLHA